LHVCLTSVIFPTYHLFLSFEILHFKFCVQKRMFEVKTIVFEFVFWAKL